MSDLRESFKSVDSNHCRRDSSSGLACWLRTSRRYESDVRPLLDEILQPIQVAETKPGGQAHTMMLTGFVESEYLPWLKSQRRPSVYSAYSLIWKNHIARRVEGVYIRDFSTPDANRLLLAIAVANHLASNTLKHIKMMLSAAFTHAKRMGFFPKGQENPMKDAELPKGEREAETAAYLLPEVHQMLTMLPEPARTIVATAAFTGAREGELRGFNVEDYNGHSLYVSRSLWRSHVNQPKGKSAGEIPVIGPLAKMLDAHIRRLGRSEGPLFVGPKGARLRTDALVYRVIRPHIECCRTCGKRGIEHADADHKFVRDESKLHWQGWHGFRRGLGTNLHDLGVDTLTIQAILRHADPRVTEQAYIKRLPQQSIDAMKRLEAIIDLPPALPESGILDVLIKKAV